MELPMVCIFCITWPVLTLLHARCTQVLQAKTKVANGRIFDLAIKLSQGDLPDQIMKVSHFCL
jgi:hypothetical protein